MDKLSPPVQRIREILLNEESELTKIEDIFRELNSIQEMISQV